MACKLLPVERPLTPATLLPINPELDPAPTKRKNENGYTNVRLN